ncbi:molybdopterin molybdotransferase MoeA [Streptomyces sp. ICBB 8177]|uniref:molybdopterin molybdotransferase MoeA n=1 Tax=Streptomyces sp. ICBB 8177 TaxID=563922 RepID=UPI000D6845BA|nr:molybdopterin molybdotransferase MoeA [Streptomyces sp. ICBB 8177]PWI41170.1 molybdopterin molybdenumtransferase MoeA [Streptomyces sp. ICBB 8177]
MGRRGRAAREGRRRTGPVTARAHPTTAGPHETGARAPHGDHAPGATARKPAAEPPYHPHGGLPWPDARRVAQDAGRRLTPVTLPLRAALGQVLAAPLTAAGDLPPFDTSAMDGWAVSGPGPWRLSGQLLAGQRSAQALAEGWAIRIATGAALPPGATAVLRREGGHVEHPAGQPTAWLHALPAHATDPAGPAPGQDIRPRGQECRAEDELLPCGTLLGPAALGLAAAAGRDDLTVVPAPHADVFVLGDELLDAGPPSDGRVRDALGPLLPPWLRALGVEPGEVRRLEDDADTLRRAVAGSTADLVVTTGGTAAGPVDFVRPVLDDLDAELLVDGVAVRPGHPMLLARLPGGRPLVGLPGNPLAAVCGLLTLVAPLARTLAGRPQPAPRRARLAEDVRTHATDTRLVPVSLHGLHGAHGSSEEEGEQGMPLVRPLRFGGPAMLRGIACADAMAVVPPGDSAMTRHTQVEILPLATGAL